jgi:hypothetical protein
LRRADDARFGGQGFDSADGVGEQIAFGLGATFGFATRFFGGRGCFCSSAHLLAYGA